jgi:superfamily II DNA or RNA helicase
MKFTPMPHQISALEAYKLYNNRMIFVCPMGGGKTLTAINIANKNNKKMIIVAPKRLKTQWKSQIIDFEFGTEDQIMVCDCKEHLIYALKEQYKFIILHYELTRDLQKVDEIINLSYKYKILKTWYKKDQLKLIYRKSNLLFKAIEKIKEYESNSKVNKPFKDFDENNKQIINNISVLKHEDYMVVLDELFKVKNYKSQLSKAYGFFSIYDWSGLVSLDAWPAYNNPWESYNVANVTKQGIISWEEMNNFCYQTKWKEWKFRNLEGFNKILSERVLYRISEDEIKANLPELSYQNHEVQVSQEALRFKDYLVKNVGNIFMIFTILRTLDSYLNLDNVVENEDSEVYKIIKNYKVREFVNAEKLEALNDILERIGDEKIIIFSSFERSIKWLYECLKKDYKVNYITGSTKDKDFESIKNDFKNTNKTQILLCSDAMSRGGDFPLIKILLNWDCTPSNVSMLQRSGRIRRITATKFEQPKLIISLVSNIVEMDILEIIKEKQRMASIIVTGEDNGYKFSEETLMVELSKRWGIKFNKS